MKLYIEDIDHNTFENKGENTAHFVYADGTIEPGYDIVTYAEGDVFDFEHDRIEDVTAVWPDGTEIPARLFFWHEVPENELRKAYMKENPVWGCHGRVVALSDTEALEIAAAKYNERSRNN